MICFSYWSFVFAFRWRVSMWCCYNSVEIQGKCKALIYFFYIIIHHLVELSDSLAASSFMGMSCRLPSLPRVPDSDHSSYWRDTLNTMMMIITLSSVWVLEFDWFVLQVADSLVDLLWEHVHQTWLDGFAAKDNNSWML